MRSLGGKRAAWQRLLGYRDRQSYWGVGDGCGAEDTLGRDGRDGTLGMDGVVQNG